MHDVTPFQIRVVKQITFRDLHGTVTRVYNVGDILWATAESRGLYYVHSYGGIFLDEAERVVPV